ncbi:MAG TPA: histidine kinase [Chitinophagales bacterium]|nr:histidine kinase [Chitinophagales bacterium]
MGSISRYNKTINIAIHLIIWIVLFAFPVFFRGPNEKANYPWLIVHAWIPLVEYMIVFYANYITLTNKLLFKKKYLAYALVNALLIAFFLWINGKCQGALTDIELKRGTLPDLRKFPPPPVITFILADLISFFVPIAFAVAMSSTELWMKTESEKKEVENKNLESELQHLRYQLQPHFFFNALNNIYALVEQSPSRAQEAIHNLSKLMRYLLYDVGKDKIELSLEIDFLKKYIQLMELRHNERTITRSVFPETKSTHQIAPLLFISMIENAYKHGVSATQASDISFEMKVVDNEVFFISRNTNFPKNKSDKSGSGIGLNNLKKRLELIYPEKYEFKSGVIGNDYFIELKIVLN